MRINKPLKVHKWLPVFAAMRPMIAELEAHPEKGMIKAQFALIGSSPALEPTRARQSTASRRSERDADRTTPPRPASTN